MPKAGLSAKPRSQASRDDWARALRIKPVVDAPLERAKGCVIRRWRDTHPDVRQPSLDEHYVVLHLGGAKRVHRSIGRSVRTADIDVSGISIMPVGAAYNWRTEGPIDYAHIYIPPRRMIHAAETIFDRQGNTIGLLEHGQAVFGRATAWR